MPEQEISTDQIVDQLTQLRTQLIEQVSDVRHRQANQEVSAEDSKTIEPDSQSDTLVPGESPDIDAAATDSSSVEEVPGNGNAKTISFAEYASSISEAIIEDDSEGAEGFPDTGEFENVNSSVEADVINSPDASANSLDLSLSQRINRRIARLSVATALLIGGINVVGAQVDSNNLPESTSDSSNNSEGFSAAMQLETNSQSIPSRLSAVTDSVSNGRSKDTYTQETQKPDAKEELNEDKITERYLEELGAKDKRAYVEFLKQYAMESQEEYGIPWQVTVGQAILKSGYGSYIVEYNLFGIKGEGPAGSNVLLTKEENEYGLVNNVQREFAAYKNLKEAFEAHAKQVYNNGYYNKALENNLIEFYIVGISEGEKDSTYETKLRDVIRDVEELQSQSN